MADEQPFEELLARLQAEQDQAQASVLMLARMLGLYRKALILEGFALDDAADLCAAFHDAFLQGVFSSGGDED